MSSRGHEVHTPTHTRGRGLFRRILHTRQIHYEGLADGVFFKAGCWCSLYLALVIWRIVGMDTFVLFCYSGSFFQNYGVKMYIVMIKCRIKWNESKE